MQLTASNCLMGPPCHQALLGGSNTSVQEAHLVGPKGACQGWLQRYMPFAALSGFPFWHHPLPLLSPACQCQPHSLFPQQGLKVADSSTATRWPQTTRKWPRGGWSSEHHGSFGPVSLILAKCFRICSLCRLLNNPARWASRWGGRQSSDYLCFAETESQMKRVIGVDMLSLTSPSPLTWGLSHTRLPLSP